MVVLRSSEGGEHSSRPVIIMHSPTITVPWDTSVLCSDYSFATFCESLTPHDILSFLYDLVEPTKIVYGLSKSKNSAS